MKLIGAAFALMIAVVAVLAQGNEPSTNVADTAVAALEDTIDRAQLLVADDEASDAALGETRVAVEAAAVQLAERRDRLTAEADALTARLEALGEATDGEDAEVTAQRRRLGNERSALAAQIGRLDEDISNADEIENAIVERRRALFSETLFGRQDIGAALAQDPVRTLVREARQIGAIVSSWVQRTVANEPSNALTAILVIVAGALGAIAVTVRLRGALSPLLPGGDRPTYLARVVRAFAIIVLRTLGLIVFAAFAVAVLNYFLALDGPIETFLLATISALIGLQFALTVLHAALSPDRPAWRLFDLDDRAARLLFWLASAVAFVFVFDVWFGRVSALTAAPVSLVLAQNLIAALLNGALLIAIARMTPGRLGTAEAPVDLRASESEAIDRDVDPAQTANVPTQAQARSDARAQSWPFWVRVPLLVVGAGLIVASLLGYIGLAQFTAQQIVVTGAILTTMSIGLQAARAVSNQGALRTSSIGRAVHRRRPIAEARFDQIGVVLSLLIGAAVLLVGLPLILLQWGFSANELGAWGVTAFRGFRVGNLTISLSGILLGVAILAGGWVLTRAFQRWLDGTVMERGRVDEGVRNSIRTVVGYVGLVIVALFALSAAGVNFASLAVVAGALSVGIGFGLQNVVSNFVSGLILLAERPFKVGDIVETGAVLGVIQKISVRSTTIETFTKQSVIVPNSDLINGVVSNWTLGNRATRADIPVGVSYDANPREVQEILLSIAREHPLSLTDPEPMIVFNGFGASSLDFELRLYLDNVSDKIPTVNEICYRIHERLAEAGVEIPYPQQDIHIRSTVGDKNSDTLPFPQAA